MAKTKQEFIAEGRANYNPDTAMPSFAEGDSWQAKAFAEGWRIEYHLDRDRQEQEARRQGEQVNREPEAVAPVPTTVSARLPHHSTVMAQERRFQRLRDMSAGYLEAMQWAETDDDGDPLDLYELHESARDRAYHVCAQFYDKHHVDLGAFVDLHEQGRGGRVEHNAWECVGHDLWLTTKGHGAGFWDRGMGGIGERLSADCGYHTSFPPRDAYVGDDGLVYLDN